MKTRKSINFALNTKKGDREVNEDSLLCSYNKSNEFCAIICDGIGSISGSKAASQLVCDVFSNAFKQLEKINDPRRWCKETLAICLNELAQTEKDLQLPGISTTLAMLIITADNRYYSFNIGDTRIYKLDESSCKILTFDHNYRNYLIRQGSPDEVIEAAKSKWNSLTNYIDASRPNAARFEANSGDITGKTLFLLCTDGMYNNFTCDELHHVIWTKAPLPITLKSYKLMKYCLGKDTSDNLSSILVVVK